MTAFDGAQPRHWVVDGVDTLGAESLRDLADGVKGGGV